MQSDHEADDLSSNEVMSVQFDLHICLDEMYRAKFPFTLYVRNVWEGSNNMTMIYILTK